MREPALADEVTAQLYALSVRQARAWALVWAFGLVFLAATIWVLIVWPGFVDTYSLVVTAAAWVALVVGAFSQTRTPLRTAGVPWRAATGRLLAEQPWRESPAKVLNERGTVLVLPGGEYVRVVGLPAAAREVVVRARRIWMVGPDAAGKLAVRVDGLHTAWPARRVPPRPGTAALPTGEPVVVMAVRLLHERVAAAFRASLMGTALLVTAAVAPGARWVNFLIASSGLLVAVAVWLRRRQLVRLRPTGPWVRAEAGMPRWRARRNGVADGTVTLTFPDGRTRTAHIERAPLDLFANVVREKALWVLAPHVVGFPHYPLVAAARITVTPTRVPPVPSGG